MMGSGTIPVLASVAGHRAVGFDTDPLAVIISRTWAQRLDYDALTESTHRVTEWARSRARRLSASSGAIRAGNGCTADDESQAFIDYWFDRPALRRLGALANAIADEPSELRDALWCSFSRLIVTKDAGASRARDVSHSRPHRVRAQASFNPIDRFAGATRSVIARHSALDRRRAGKRRLRLERADARNLPVRAGTIDAVITSPPYLQAIDYLRGHRLSLVWMGYGIGELRQLRSESVGTERGLYSAGHEEAIQAIVGHALSARGFSIVRRYAADLSQILREVRRVLRPRGRAALVVAEASLEGAPVRISALLEVAARRNGMHCVARERRDLPAHRRYLPPPTEGGTGALDRRMRSEWCLTFRAARPNH